MNPAPANDIENVEELYVDSDSDIDSGDDSSSQLCVDCGSSDNCICERNNTTDFFITAVLSPGGESADSVDHWLYQGPNNDHNPENDED
jgi:hypothetical protein